MTVERAAEAIQLCYPQVYHACHTRHGRGRSDSSRLSGRDAQVLVHLDRSRPLTLTALARHMGLATSTLSEAVTRLEALGHVKKTRAGAGADRRRVGIVLTPAGLAAVRASSVLEADRLRVVLRRLSAADRAAVADGLERLARACRPSTAEKQRHERRPRA